MNRIKALLQAKAQDQFIASLSIYLSSFDWATWILTLLSLIVMLSATKAALEFIFGISKSVYLSVVDIKTTEHRTPIKVIQILWHRLNESLFSIGEDYM